MRRSCQAGSSLSTMIPCAGAGGSPAAVGAGGGGAIVCGTMVVLLPDRKVATQTVVPSALANSVRGSFPKMGIDETSSRVRGSMTTTFRSVIEEMNASRG